MQHLHRRQALAQVAHQRGGALHHQQPVDGHTAGQQRPRDDAGAAAQLDHPARRHRVNLRRHACGQPGRAGADGADGARATHQFAPEQHAAVAKRAGAAHQKGATHGRDGVAVMKDSARPSHTTGAGHIATALRAAAKACHFAP